MKFSCLLLSGLIFLGGVAPAPLHTKPAKKTQKSRAAKSKKATSGIPYGGQLIGRGFRYLNTGQYSKAREIVAKMRRMNEKDMAMFADNLEAQVNEREWNAGAAARKKQDRRAALLLEDAQMHIEAGRYVRAQLCADELRKMGRVREAVTIEDYIRLRRGQLF